MKKSLLVVAVLGLTAAVAYAADCCFAGAECCKVKAPCCDAAKK